MRKLAIAPVVAVAALLAGCGNMHGDSDLGAAPPGPTAAAMNLPVSASGAAGDASLPSFFTLAAALLTASDAGAGFTQENAPTATPGSITGCTDLEAFLDHGVIPHVDQTEAAVVVSSDAAQSTIGESLIAEPPATVNGDYGQFTRGSKTCTSMQNSDNDALFAVRISPMSFGPDTAGLRGDEDRDGTPVTVYAAVTKVAPDVLLSFTYASGAPGSARLAAAAFQQAVTKAASQLGSA